MSTVNSNKATVAVIGLGNIGSVVAANLVKGNRRVIIANKTLEKATGLAKQLGPLTQPMEVSAAIKAADIIILAIWFDTIKEFLAKYANELQGKIIIDPSNPIALDGKGGYKKIIGEQESAGAILSALTPANATLVKAFGTLGAASLSNAAFQQPAPAVLFYASDDVNVNTTIEDLIKDSGFTPVRVGTLDQSIRIEVFGDLHEYGPLGGTITADKVKL